LSLGATAPGAVAPSPSSNSACAPAATKENPRIV
jgi:hypothetical protein